MFHMSKRDITGIIRTIRRERKLKSKWIERFILAVIFINAVSMGLETCPGLNEDQITCLKIIDRVALYIFTLEILMKMLVSRARFYKNPWNIFDFIIIGVSWIPEGGSLAMLRSLRILRVFLFVSFLPKLRFIVQSLLQSLQGIFGISLLLAIIFYVFGVMATMQFHKVDAEKFGNLAVSCLSLFHIMTLDSWTGVIAPLLKEKPYAYFFFIPFILLSTYIILNIFIAIIVNGMREARLKNEEKQRKRERKENRRENQERSDIALHTLLEKLDRMEAGLDALREEVRQLKQEEEKNSGPTA